MTDLELHVVRDMRPYQDGDLDGIDSEAKAIAEMVRRSGLREKTLAIECEVDPATLSKAQTGQARLAEAQMDRLMDACGSELWLSYWLSKRQYDPRFLRRFETELERENRELREQLEALQREREIEIRYARELKLA